MNYSKQVFIENQSSHLDSLKWARNVISQITVTGTAKLKVAHENYGNFIHAFDIIKGQGYVILEELHADGFIHLDFIEAN